MQRRAPPLLHLIRRRFGLGAQAVAEGQAPGDHRVSGRMDLQVDGAGAGVRVVAGEVAPPGHAVLPAPAKARHLQRRAGRVDRRQIGGLAQKVDDRPGRQTRCGVEPM